MASFFSFHPLWKTYDTIIHVDETDSIPEQLRTAINGKHECAFSKGFVSFIDPSRHRDIFHLWGLQPKTCFPFLQFAFGQFVFFHDGQYKILDPVYNTIDIAGGKGDYDFVMNILLCDKPGLENSNFMDVYFETVDTLSPPSLDECYAFVPALRLGGSRDKTHVKKVSLQEQLMILSQI